MGSQDICVSGSCEQNVNTVLSLESKQNVVISLKSLGFGILVCYISCHILWNPMGETEYVARLSALDLVSIDRLCRAP